MTEIRDGAMKKLLEKLRRLSDEIEKINRRFDLLDRTGNTLKNVRVRADHYENEMTTLRRQVERGSAPMLPQNQRARTDRLRSPCTLGNAAACLGF